MDIYSAYKSPLGYQIGNNGVDSYGVDHGRFNIRDEIEYQTARENREQELIKNYERQGLAKGNYPQYGTNFWGNSENNYGFGSSNIGDNVQNVTNRLKNRGWDNGMNHRQSFSVNNYASNTNNVFTQPNNNLQSGVPNNISSTLNKVKNFAKNVVNTVAPYTPTYYAGYGIGSIKSDLENQNGYINSVKRIIELNNQYNPMRINDKYKHAMINCLMAQGGPKSEKVSQITSGLKENYDVFMNKNTSKASDEDMEANIYGRATGRNNPYGSCQELISKKYKP